MESIRESCSALCSAMCKNLTAAACGHSLAKAVLLLAGALFGLIGTKHFVHLPFVVWYSTTVSRTPSLTETPRIASIRTAVVDKFCLAAVRKDASAKPTKY